MQVVPDSATSELTGLNDTLNIDIRDGQHPYNVTYACPRADAAA
ncbi:MAG: DUF3224 domain-containing protein [Burkholderiales bacterium]|nr:DUF3224 domain-containing protein [Burkholderiales bacterium]